MDFVKSWVIGVCLTLVVCAVFSLVAPHGSMGRFAKVIISVFIFISLIYPFADFDFSQLSAEGMDIEAQFEDTQLELSSSQVENIVGNVLLSHGVSGAEVECRASQTAEGISIDSVKVLLTDSTSPDDARRWILGETGVAAQVSSATESKGSALDDEQD